MARRTRQESLETRERLLDAALEVFQTRGASTPSLSDIAARAGVTRGAVYVHFANKADLFSALCERSALPMYAPSCRCPDAESPLARLRALLVYRMRQTATNPELRQMSDIVFHKCEKHEGNAAIVERMRERRLRALEAIKTLGREAVQKGELPADLDVDRALPFVHACLIGVLSEWLFVPNGVDLAAEAEARADALIEMLRSSPSLRTGAPGAGEG